MLGDAILSGMAVALLLLNGFVFGLVGGYFLWRPRPEPKPEPKMQTFHIVEPSGGESVRKVPREDNPA